MSELKITKQLDLINVLRGLIISLVIIGFFGLPFVNFYHFFTPEEQRFSKAYTTCLERYKLVSQKDRAEICFDDQTNDRYVQRLFASSFNREPQFNSFVYLGWGFLGVVAAGLFLTRKKAGIADRNG